jgi:hypothetical protein
MGANIMYQGLSYKQKKTFFKMLTFFTTASLASMLVHCKHRSRSESSLDSFERNYEDTFFVNSDIVRASDACRAQLINMASNSLADGLLVNGALTGLGTDAPTGKKLTTDGAYTQALRIYSLFDWEMHNRLVQPKQSLCLPQKIHLSYASSAKDETSSFRRPFPEQVKKARQSFENLSKDAWAFDIAEVDGFTGPSLWPRTPQSPSNYQKALRNGYQARLNQVTNYTSNGTDLKTKLKAFAMAYSPLGLTFDASFPSADPAKGKTFLEVYLPPLSELRTPSTDEADTWYLERGVKRRELPKPYDIGIAKLTHIAYLQSPGFNGQPAIKLQILKDYGVPNVVKTHVVFGKVAEDGPEKGILPLDYRGNETAFIISFYPNLAESTNDSATTKFLKKEVNKVINAFRVDARIHQLAVDLERKPNGDPIEKGPDSVMLRPRFSLRGSDISFRLFIDTEKGLEVKALQSLGFTCEKGPSSETCFRDFGSYADASTFFGEGPKGIIGEMKAAVSKRFQGMINLLIRYNAKVLINWNIEGIEEAINQQFLEITRDITENQLEMRSRIQERLERLIFDAG